MQRYEALHEHHAPAGHAAMVTIRQTESRTGWESRPIRSTTDSLVAVQEMSILQNTLSAPNVEYRLSGRHLERSFGLRAGAEPDGDISNL